MSIQCKKPFAFLRNITMRTKISKYNKKLKENAFFINISDFRRINNDLIIRPSLLNGLFKDCCHVRLLLFSSDNKADGRRPLGTTSFIIRRLISSSTHATVAVRNDLLNSLAFTHRCGSTAPRIILLGYEGKNYSVGLCGKCR